MTETEALAVLRTCQRLAQLAYTAGYVEGIDYGSLDDDTEFLAARARDSLGGEDL
ncbi:MAG: hypothetical protein ACRDQA_02895 [Nocardioidaceae bacterium]